MATSPGVSPPGPPSDRPEVYETLAGADPHITNIISIMWVQANAGCRGYLPVFEQNELSRDLPSTLTNQWTDTLYESSYIEDIYKKLLPLYFKGIPMPFLLLLRCAPNLIIY